MKLPFFLYLTLISISIIATGCKREMNLHDEIQLYLKNHSNVTLTENIRNIMILTENDCVNCNKSYSHFMLYNLQRINFNSTLLIINASGAKIDISGYDSQNTKILFENKKHSREYPFLNKSAYIRFKADKNVDTLIEINSEQTEEKLAYIATQIK